MLKSILQPIMNPILASFYGEQLYDFRQLGAKNLCWLDFIDINFITLASGKISSMTDKSSNARVFSQSNTGNRPTYTSNGAVFLRTLDYLVHNGAFFANLAGGFRVFATAINETESAGGGGVFVCESNFTADSRPYFNALAKATDGGTLRNRIGAEYRTNTAGAYLLTPATTQSNVISLSTTEYNLVSMQDSGTIYSNFTNTVLSNQTSYTRTGAITPTNRTTIGALLNTTTFSLTAGFTTRDILITTNDLTTTELDKIHGTLLWRVGRPDKLPSNHPFRFQPPYM